MPSGCGNNRSIFPRSLVDRIVTEIKYFQSTLRDTLFPQQPQCSKPAVEMLDRVRIAARTRSSTTEGSNCQRGVSLKTALCASEPWPWDLDSPLQTGSGAYRTRARGRGGGVPSLSKARCDPTKNPGGAQTGEARSTKRGSALESLNHGWYQSRRGCPSWACGSFTRDDTYSSAHVRLRGRRRLSRSAVTAVSSHALNLRGQLPPAAERKDQTPNHRPAPLAAPTASRATSSTR